MPFLTSSYENDILETDLPCNAVFVDAGTRDETLIFTTFPYNQGALLDISDGIILFLRGKGIGQLKSSLDFYVDSAPKFAGGGHSGNVTSSLKIASFNMLRMGQDKKDYYESARVIIDGGFDLVGVMELMVPIGSTNAPVIGSGNQGAGRGLEDLVANLDSFSGSGSWGHHAAQYNVGRSTYREYYGYVYKKSRVSFIGVPPGGIPHGTGTYDMRAPDTGYYNDTSKEFIRPPYAARFKSAATDVTFTYVLQHAEFGAPVDREREAGILYKVYREFRADPTRRAGIPEGEEIIIGGDFNLPADSPSFDTMKTGAGVGTYNLTYALHAETLTTVGNNGFVSAYDNFWYSSNTSHKRVLGTGRGAYTDWVTLNNYSSYPNYSNNYTYVNTFISDHVPVYITFNTTVCTIDGCTCMDTP
jgi:hypothetical protein